jgi:hypothetical protein
MARQGMARQACSGGSRCGTVWSGWAGKVLKVNKAGKFMWFFTIENLIKS